MDDIVHYKNIENYNHLYSSGYDHSFPNIDLVRLESAFLAEKRGGKLLDYGCGTGANSIYLAQSSHLVSAVDASEEAIKLIYKKLKKDQYKSIKLNLDIININAKRLDYQDETFDSIVCMSVLSLLGKKENINFLIKEFFRILKPAGRLVIDINGPRSNFVIDGAKISENIYHYKLKNYSNKIVAYCVNNKKDFSDLFNDFEIFDIGETYFDACGKYENEYIVCAIKK